MKQHAQENGLGVRFGEGGGGIILATFIPKTVKDTIPMFSVGGAALPRLWPACPCSAPCPSAPAHLHSGQPAPVLLLAQQPCAMLYQLDDHLWSPHTCKAHNQNWWTFTLTTYTTSMQGERHDARSHYPSEVGG